MTSLYRALLGLLPPDVWKDREAAAATFEAMWRDARSWRARAGLAFLAFGRLPGVLALEWFEFLGARPAPGRTRRGGGTMGAGKHARYAIRTLAKTPSFTLTAILLVALGVGAVTTIFTVVDHVLLRPLPYPDPDRLVVIENGSHSGPFLRRVEDMQSFEGVSASFYQDVTLVGEGDPLRLRQVQVTDGYFDLYGARAVRGRLFNEEDHRTGDAVVLDGRAWRTTFGSDPDIVGKTIEVDGHPLTVIGVADPAFSPPPVQARAGVDVWRPLDRTREELTRHDYHVVQIVARLRPGTTREAAQHELDAVAAAHAQVAENYRQEDGSPRELPLTRLDEVTVRGVREGLGQLMAAVGLLLLVACANVAHLFLARGLGRTREIAVRRALGARTGSLLTQLTVESVLVGLAGGLLGAFGARLGVASFLAIYPQTLPREVTTDLAVLGFAVGVSLLTAVAFGVFPGLRFLGRDPADELRGSGRSASSGRRIILVRNALVAAEVALSLVLVASAGLLLRSFLEVRGQEPGFDVADVWTIPLTPTEIETPQAHRALMVEVMRSVESVPGVQSATYGLTMPLELTGGGRCCWRSSVTVDGEDAGGPYFHPVSETYFETLGIPIVAGRVWGPGEALGAPWPAVVSEAWAIETFGAAEAAVGRQLGGNRGPWEIVGVTVDTRHYGLDREHGPAVYVPIESLPFPIPMAHIAVKAGPGAGSGLPSALRKAVWSASPRLPVPIVRPLEEWASRSTADRRFRSAVFGTFAAVALLLAAGGIYGTLLFTAGQRRREMGIRLALGASRRTVERRFVTIGLVLSLVGITLGLAGAWFAGRVLESQVWGVERTDPVTLTGAAALLVVTALVASWLPARRAGRVDPVETLRVE